MLNWDASKQEYELASLIAQRATRKVRDSGVIESKDCPKFQRTTLMDIIAVHRNGCPLRLEDLLAADNFEFTHDVFGIRRHLDRDTGKLQDCFLPRFSR